MKNAMSTIISAGRKENIKEIETRTGFDVRMLPTTKKYKIGVKFKIYRKG